MKKAMPAQNHPLYAEAANKFAAFVLLLFGFLVGFAATTLAQPGAGFKGKPMGPQVNSPQDELAPRLSLDGNTMYFTRTGGPESKGVQDVWTSRKLADGSWSTAKVLDAPVNNERHNVAGGFGEPGSKLYLSNTYGNLPSPGISVSARTSGGWSEPETILSMRELGLAVGYFDFFVDHEQSVMLISMSRQDDPGAKEDLYFWLRISDGSWEGPYSLGEDINTPGSEMSPSLSPDGRFLFFAADGRGGLGDMDIFMSERLDDSFQIWSEPVNLGEAVNTPGFDAWFVMGPDYHTCYFVSGASKAAAGDIYSVDAADIPGLQKPAEVVADTLRIFARENTPLPVSFEAFGVTDKMAPLSSGRSLDGGGQLLVRGEEPSFVYQPAPGFSGMEHLELTVCDPPHSDDCKKIVVLADVAPEAGSMPPTFVTIRTRTPQNTAVKLDLGGRLSEMVDIRRSNTDRAPTQGMAGKSAEIGGEHVFYRPAPEFIGTDTLDLYMHCDKPRPADCLVARVIVDVYDDAAISVVPDTEETTESDLRVHGKTFDEKTGMPLGAELVFTELPANKVFGTVKSDVNTGEYEIELPAGTQYAITAKEQYHFETSSLVPASARDNFRRDLSLSPLPTEVGTVFKLENIYFDLDKATLKEESREELTRLYGFLKANPTMKIRIEGHTDNWSSDEYNITLSQARSQAVVNYLKYKGIMGTRLEAKGFGEAVPVADNATEEGRALNRRVEFRIMAR